jgi:DNA-binding XRE family transcriptional regulator
MRRPTIERVSKLTDARIRADLTVKQLAEVADVSEDTIKRAEDGKRIGLRSRQRIVNALSAKLGIPFARSDFWPEEVA